jgi:NAD kinase
MAGTTHPVRTRHTSQTRIACVHSGSARARASHDELAGCDDLVGPEESDVIVALGSDGFMLRPRRWRGALLLHTTEVVFENLDPQKRPLTATADFKEIFDVVSVTVREDRSTAVTLLFDPDHSLEDRIAAEQFAF